MELEFCPKFEPNNSCGSENFQQHYCKMDATLHYVLDPSSSPCGLKADSNDQFSYYFSQWWMLSSTFTWNKSFFKSGRAAACSRHPARGEDIRHCPCHPLSVAETWPLPCHFAFPSNTLQNTGTIGCCSVFIVSGGRFLSMLLRFEAASVCSGTFGHCQLCFCADKR